MFYRSVGKRVFDILVSGTLLALCSPLLVLVTLGLWFFNAKEIFFLQERPGLNGKSFFIYKFKTMTDARDSKGDLLPDSQRVTPLGKFIRKFSLDELLQLVNVVKGDMSLIGPRPLLVEYLPYYSPVQRRRHEVRPGITGLAQVKGRNQLSWERRFRYDVYYVDHLSLKLDLLILWMTLIKVVKGGDTEFPEGLEDTRFKGSFRRSFEPT